MTSTPLSLRIVSALAVVGPLAPSATIFALTSAAFLAVIWFSLAHGASTSTSRASSSSLEIGSAPSKPASERPCASAIGDRGVDVDAVGVVVAARHVADGDDLAPLLAEQLGRHRADVAEALHGDRRLARPHAQTVHGAQRRRHDAAPGRLAAALGAADQERLAGHDGRLGPPGVHRVRVEQPGHDLLVGVHVRRRDVLVGPEHVDQVGRVAARQPLDLAGRHRAGVARDAALGAAERARRRRRTSTSSRPRAP